MRRIAADHRPAAMPRPRHEHGLDRTVDDVGLLVQPGADLRDEAAELRQALFEERGHLLALVEHVRRLRPDVEEIHEVLADRHGADLALDPLPELHAGDAVLLGHLNAPGTVAAVAGHEHRTEKLRARGGADPVKSRHEVERGTGAIRKHDRRAIALRLIDLRHMNTESDLDARLSGGVEQDSVQVGAGKGAERRHAVVAQQELVLRDQPPFGIDDRHVIVGKADLEDLFENAQRVIDPQGVGGLPQADARNLEIRPALDHHHLDAALGESEGRGKAADATPRDQNMSDVAHAHDQCF